VNGIPLISGDFTSSIVLNRTSQVWIAKSGTHVKWSQYSSRSKHPEPAVYYAKGHNNLRNKVIVRVKTE